MKSVQHFVNGAVASIAAEENGRQPFVEKLAAYDMATICNIAAWSLYEARGFNEEMSLPATEKFSSCILSAMVWKRTQAIPLTVNVKAREK